MQIIKKNLKGGEVTLKVDSGEDLWYLSQLISPGDLVSGKTERKIKLDRGGADSKAAVVKKTIFLKLSAQRVEFSKTTDELRVLGVVVEGPDDVPHGSHHTVEIEPGTVTTITKEEWLGYQLERLDEAVQSIKSKVVIVVFDREEAIFALLKGQGFEVLSRLKGSVSKKRVEAGETKNFYQEIIQVLREYDKRFAPQSIIAASPSFWKEYLMKELASDPLRKKIALATASDVDENSISEVMKRPELSKVMESDRAAKELGLVDGLLAAISKDEGCYGIKECSEKIDSGAVREILVSYDFLNKTRDEEKHRQVEALLKLCEKRGGKVHIISTDGAQKKLVGLGGIAGILRWKGA